MIKIYLPEEYCGCSGVVIVVCGEFVRIGLGGSGCMGEC